MGLFGIGLEAYWPQFVGLKARLQRYIGSVDKRLARPDIELCNLGLIDSPEKAMEAGHQFRAADVDLIFLHVATYALSSTVLPVVHRAKVPGDRAEPAPACSNRLCRRSTRWRIATKMTGEWLACGACPVPEIANVFNRAGIQFLPGHGDVGRRSGGVGEVDEWVEAARVAKCMAHNRLGVMGHYYSGMLDIYADVTLQCAMFGGHMEYIEVDELAALRRKGSLPRFAASRRGFHESVRCRARLRANGIGTGRANRRCYGPTRAQHKLGSIAYYYQGTGNAENENVISSIILGEPMLTSRGIPVAGEYEMRNAQAMKIMDSFGAGGSFTEYYAMDFNDDVVLMGHDGPGHMAIAEGKTKVRPLGYITAKWAMACR